MFIWSGRMYTLFQHWPGVLDTELWQFFYCITVKQFTKFFFPDPYHLSSQAHKDQGPRVMLALREEDLVKALAKRSPRKFNLRNHPFYKHIFRIGKARPQTGLESIWGHSASDRETSRALFANDIKVLKEPSKHFVHSPTSRQQALQEPRLWDFPGVQWLRIHLAKRGMQVRSLVLEDPTCQGTAFVKQWNAATKTWRSQINTFLKKGFVLT